VSDYYITDIPSYTLAALERYRDGHCPVGDFLQAVIANDLRESLGRADEANTEALQKIVWWVYNELPSPAQGSAEAYREWIANRTEE